MRLAFVILFCGLTGFVGPGQAFSQTKVVVSGNNAAAVSSKTSELQNPTENGANAQVKKVNGPNYQGGGMLSSDSQDYQKDNPLLKTDLNKTSEFQGKMFANKDFKVKQFEGAGKDQPIVLNKMFVQNSTLTGNKNDWQNQESELKKSDLGMQQSSFIDKKNNKTGLNGTDVPLKIADGFDSKSQDVQKAKGFAALLGDGQKRYAGPESPNSPSEMELIQDRLKQANSPEELKKNQLTTDEVKKLLQPEVPLTRPK